MMAGLSGLVPFPVSRVSDHTSVMLAGVRPRMKVSGVKSPRLSGEGVVGAARATKLAQTRARKRMSSTFSVWPRDTCTKDSSRL